MTFEQACIVYMAHTKANKTVKRLMAWNPEVTILQNAEAMGIDYSSAHTMAIIYKLKFKSCKGVKPQARFIGGTWVFKEKKPKDLNFGDRRGLRN